MNRWLTLAYRMLRPRTVLMMLLFAAIGDAAVKQAPNYDPRLILIAVLLGCLFVGATTINDIADEEIDKINLATDKRRPLAVASAQKSDLKILNGVSFALATITAFAIKPILIVVVLVAWLLSYLYSMPPVKISHRGLVAPLILPLNYVALPFLIGASIHPGSWNFQAEVLLLGLYVSFIGRIILKDFRDVKGDRMFGKRTFIVRYGARKTCGAASIAWLAGDVIISGLFIHSDPLLVLLLQPFIAGILLTLHTLAQEQVLARQLTLVNLVGRLGNSVALSVLTVITLKLYGYEPIKNSMLLLLVTAVNVYASYFLYDYYVRQSKAITV